MTLQHHEDDSSSRDVEGLATEVANEATGASGLSAWEALLAYRDALVAASTGLAKLELRYSGSGDEGSTDEIEWEPQGIRLDDLFVEALNLDLQWHPAGGWRYIPTPARRGVGDVLEAMADLAISVSGHDGYEVSDGGFGLLRLDLSTGELTLEHHDCYVASTKSFHDLSDGVTDAPAAVELDENGIPVRKLHFGLCGGAGDDC